MLQALYHLPAFRRLIYDMDPTSTKPDEDNIALNLQWLFARMQTGHGACSTASLTRSFGWGGLETFMQHDVQEFCRVLLDNLEMKMKGTPLEPAIAALFRGKCRSYVRCKHVPVETSREEDFYDLSLLVKDLDGLRDSFLKYLEKEELIGNNQYQTETYGKQDAEMGVEFLEFPSVLHLHLRRFEYDFASGGMSKLNSRFEFPPEIDLGEFLAESDLEDIFDLYGVLVHAGTSNYGHYYAFLRPTTENRWFEFNDSSVTEVSPERAIDDNFGNWDRTFSAYMLIYVRRSRADELFAPIPASAIPESALTYLDAQQERERRYEDERNSMTYFLLTRDSLEQDALLHTFGLDEIRHSHKLSFDRRRSFAEFYDKVRYELRVTDVTLYAGNYSLRRISDSSAALTSGSSVDRVLALVHGRDLVDIGDPDDDDAVDGTLVLVYVFYPTVFPPVHFVLAAEVDRDRTFTDVVVAARHRLNCESTASSQIWMITQNGGIAPMSEAVPVTLRSGSAVVIEFDPPPQFVSSLPPTQPSFLQYRLRSRALSCQVYFNAAAGLQEWRIAYDSQKERGEAAKGSDGLVEERVMIPIVAPLDEVICWLVDEVFRVNRSMCTIFRLYTTRGFRPVPNLPDRPRGLTLMRFVGISGEAVEGAIRIVFGLSRDAITIQEPHYSALFSHDATGEDLLSHVQREGLIRDAGEMRILVRGQGALTLVGLEDKLADVKNRFRVEVVPSDQQGLDVTLMPVIWKRRPKLEFMIAFDKDEQWRETREKIEEIIVQAEGKEIEEELRTCRFMFVRPSRESVDLNDWDMLSRFTGRLGYIEILGKSMPSFEQKMYAGTSLKLHN
jgi:hypothetical protein